MRKRRGKVKEETCFEKKEVSRRRMGKGSCQLLERKQKKKIGRAMLVLEKKKKLGDVYEDHQVFWDWGEKSTWGKDRKGKETESNVSGKGGRGEHLGDKPKQNEAWGGKKKRRFRWYHSVKKKGHVHNLKYRQKNFG